MGQERLKEATLYMEEQMAWKVGRDHYLVLQTYEDGWDYTLYDKAFKELDGGQLDMPELSMEEARKEILMDFTLDECDLIVADYEEIMEQAEKVEEERLVEYEVESLSRDLDQLMYDFDSYEYNDQYMNREEGVHEIRSNLLTGKTNEIKEFLQDLIIGDDMKTAIHASNLYANIEKYEKKQLEKVVDQKEEKRSVLQELKNLKMDTGEHSRMRNKIKGEER